MAPGTWHLIGRIIILEIKCLWYFYVWMCLFCLSYNAWFPELTSTGDTLLELRHQLLSQILFFTRPDGQRYLNIVIVLFPGVPGECPENELLS